MCVCTCIYVHACIYTHRERHIDACMHALTCVYGLTFEWHLLLNAGSFYSNVGTTTGLVSYSKPSVSALSGTTNLPTSKSTLMIELTGSSFGTTSYSMVSRGLCHASVRHGWLKSTLFLLVICEKGIACACMYTYLRMYVSVCVYSEHNRLVRCPSHNNQTSMSRSKPFASISWSVCCKSIADQCLDSRQCPDLTLNWWILRQTGRIGSTAVEETQWTSDTQVSVRPASGLMANVKVTVTAGEFTCVYAAYTCIWYTQVHAYM